MRDHEPDTAQELPSEEWGAEAEPLEFRLGVAAIPDRLDKVLAGLLPQHSRSRLQTWIEAGHVRLNGKPAKLRQKAGPGDRITVRPQPAPEELAFEPEEVDFAVVDESNEWIVVDKPAGLVTHPGAGNWSGTLLNGLLFRYPELARVPRAGIVHRLDKDTSGIMVVARTETAQTHLVRQLQARSVRREYLAIVHNTLASEGRVDLAIGRDPSVPVRMTVSRPIAPKPAITHYRALREGTTPEGSRVCEVACRLETGRTHQIRVHMASLGCPLIGDTLYGGRMVADANRQMLHAQFLSFEDPATEQVVSLEAELPKDFQMVVERITWLT